MTRLLYVILIATLFTSCSGAKQQFENAGGSITLSLDNEISTHIARDVTDYNTSILISQVMEGLVSMDPKTLKVRPQLAKSWVIADNGTKITFELRTDVQFHAHESLSGSDRQFTSNDVLKSIEKSCTKDEKGLPHHAYLFLYKEILQGAQEFFEGKAKSISGLQINEGKVTFILKQKDENFLSKLANVCVYISSAKLIELKKEDDMIGTGPFMFSGYNTGDVKKAILIKNQDYYLTDKAGNALPYLDSLIFIINQKKLDQLEMFENHQSDIITGLPPSRITQMLEGRIQDFNSSPPLFVMYNSALLYTNYYFFNMTEERFKNVKVRQAFNYAIDKEKIGREILQNQYYELGYYGIVPPVAASFRGYNFGDIKAASYTYDPEKARKLLAEAGYPNGKGFGSVNLRYNIGDINSAVADDFAQQIFQNLNINVNIDGSTFEQKDQDATMAKGDIFRSAWIADYLNPETFLSNFYGKAVPLNTSIPSTINQSRYQNSEFDQLYEQARNCTKLSDAMALYAKAEKILMENPPLIPLWYSGDIQIIYSDVRNLYFNPLNQLSFTEVYKKALTAEEYQKQLKEFNR
ncbi:MAG: peptide ABC transporter substrate-binding protein [Bacteroidota bacterium]